MVAVFHAAPHRVEAKHVDHSVLPSVPKAWCPKPLMVVAPANAGTYPVAIFLHGCNMVNSWASTYRHAGVAASALGRLGVSVKAEGGSREGELMLYGIALDLNDATRKVACWAADERQGLAYVLGSVLNLPGVKPDLSRLALVA
uniref:Uncharacterized protein n=1 Tax=Oryza sativa subsp. japonica TaxID=39947 RepID=Q6KA52_ORYSJ|nr:hypothetical protein [Oryza sativa Japonica Group]